MLQEDPREQVPGNKAGHEEVDEQKHREAAAANFTTIAITEPDERAGQVRDLRQARTKDDLRQPLGDLLQAAVDRQNF
jgi:hypothetical protein